MKKFFVMFVTLTLSLSLIACGKKQVEKRGSEEETTESLTIELAPEEILESRLASLSSEEEARIFIADLEATYEKHSIVFNQHTVVSKNGKQVDIVEIDRTKLEERFQAKAEQTKSEPKLQKVALASDMEWIASGLKTLRAEYQSYAKHFPNDANLAVLKAKISACSKTSNGLAVMARHVRSKKKFQYKDLNDVDMSAQITRKKIK